MAEQFPESVLLKRCFQKFRKTHRKNPKVESLFLKVCNFTKKESPGQVFSWELSEILKNTYFVQHLRTAATKKGLTLVLIGGFLYFFLLEEKRYDNNFMKTL